MFVAIAAAVVIFLFAGILATLMIMSLFLTPKKLPREMRIEVTKDSTNYTGS